MSGSVSYSTALRAGHFLVRYVSAGKLLQYPLVFRGFNIPEKTDVAFVKTTLLLQPLILKLVKSAAFN